MKILVCISRTPETTAKISFSIDAKSFDSSGVSYILNPYDEWYALVRAIELKEAVGGSVTAIHVGTSQSDTIIRKALAIGADDAVRVDAEARDARFTADQIAAYAKDKSFDAIFLGKETIDYNGSEVGGMIAELLDLPFISYASALEMDGTTAKIERDIEGGIELVEVAGPFVISAAKGLAQQRIPNMRGIMMAKRKPMEVIAAVDSPQQTSVEKYVLPEVKSEVTMVDPENMDELVRLLHEEAKVI